jgi:transcriptional regulator with XRE-family HTH domain
MVEETIGTRVKALRLARGWSQRELARRAGLYQPMIADLETGKHPEILTRNLRRLARALAVEWEALLGRVQDPRPSPGEMPWLGRSMLPQEPGPRLHGLARIVRRFTRATQAASRVTFFLLRVRNISGMMSFVPYFPHTTLDSRVSGVLMWG